MDCCDASAQQTLCRCLLYLRYVGLSDSLLDIAAQFHPWLGLAELSAQRQVRGQSTIACGPCVTEIACDFSTFGWYPMSQVQRTSRASAPEIAASVRHQAGIRL